MKILLAGGGTLGPVTPLFALVETWRKQDASVVFMLVGTPDGPERTLADVNQVAFDWLPPVRFSRSFSWEWLRLPFMAVWACARALKLLRRQRPEMIIGAGGFTQVPLIFVGRLLKIPSFILQTDVLPLLSNRLVVPFVRHIFVGWDETLLDFPATKTEKIGVPVRASLQEGSKEKAIKRFQLDPIKPTLLVLGGGTGSVWLNESFAQIAAQLHQEMNVVHITGRGKDLASLHVYGTGYYVTEHLEKGLEDAYAAADLVVARAGLGTISELSALRKPAIIIPLPKSPQERNAQQLEQAQAARVLFQTNISAEDLLEEIRLLMADENLRNGYADQMAKILQTDVADKLISCLQSLKNK